MWSVSPRAESLLSLISDRKNDPLSLHINYYCAPLEQQEQNTQPIITNVVGIGYNYYAQQKAESAKSCGGGCRRSFPRGATFVVCG
jgi:hypothetical protein